MIIFGRLPFKVRNLIILILLFSDFSHALENGEPAGSYAKNVGLISTTYFLVEENGTYKRSVKGKIEKTRAAVCHGTRLYIDIVITAAHCLFDADDLEKPVDKLTFDVSTENLDWIVEDFRIHPKFKDVSSGDDIAVLMLQNNKSRSLPFEPTYELFRENISEGTELIAVGKKSWWEKKSGTLEVLESDTNERQIGRFKLLDAAANRLWVIPLTANESPVTISPGDSGRPLIMDSNGKNYLVGVLSGFGRSKIPEGYKGHKKAEGYISIASYYDWIKTMISDLRQHTSQN